MSGAAVTDDILTRGVAYLATPYSKYPGGIHKAFAHAAALAARLFAAGVKVYSPIAHTHALADHSALDPLDHSIWLPFDEAMMAAASSIVVAHMDGWQDSNGIAFEIGVFERAGKPIFDCDPETLVITRRSVASDSVNHPSHYRRHPSGVECIEIAEHFNFNRGNALKYLWRAGEKGDAIEDLRKAAWYVNREVERVERERTGRK